MGRGGGGRFDLATRRNVDLQEKKKQKKEHIQTYTLVNNLQDDKLFFFYQKSTKAEQQE